MNFDQEKTRLNMHSQYIRVAVWLLQKQRKTGGSDTNLSSMLRCSEMILTVETSQNRIVSYSPSPNRANVLLLGLNLSTLPSAAE